MGLVKIFLSFISVLMGFLFLFVFLNKPFFFSCFKNV